MLDSSSASYMPIVLQSIVALGFVGLVLVLVPLLGPKSKGSTKTENFECGIEAQGNARVKFSVKYFLTAILFVLLSRLHQNFGDGGGGGGWRQLTDVENLVGGHGS